METNVRLLPGQSQKPRLVASEMLALCASRRMQEVVREIKEVARHHVPVVLQGESGVGKDVVARAIGEQSSRHDQPFVVVDCTAIPSTLIESELFGHERGAFTDARQRRHGRFEYAHTGTLFLDEIGELPLSFQPKFLRAIETGSFMRVGGNETAQSDFRLIVATNRDLPQMVRNKLFREDLYYRLNVFPISVPPLRERREDIVPLVKHFLRAFEKDSGTLGKEAEDALRAYHWPGNVRELRNTVARAVVKAEDSPEILPKHLLPILSSTSASPLQESKGITDLVEDLVICGERNGFGYYELADKILRRMIEKRLQQHKWNISAVARSLKLDRETTVNKMNKFGLCKSAAGAPNS